MTYRVADHPIAADRAAVHFHLFQAESDAFELRHTIAAQRRLTFGAPKARRGSSAEVKSQLDARRKAAKALRAEHYPVPSGIWGLPHAVALSDPFQTACSLPYLGGCEVPSIWQGEPDAYVEVRWFELLDIRAKCLGCAGAIGADPTI